MRGVDHVGDPDPQDMGCGTGWRSWEPQLGGRMLGGPETAGLGDDRGL